MAHPRLRVIATWAAVALSLMSIAACTALVVLTAQLHTATMVLREAISSVQIAHEAENDLLMHERAHDPLVRSELAHDLEGRIERARRHVTSADERNAVEHAAGRIAQYLSKATSAPPWRDADSDRALEAAYAAIERVIAVNVRQANAYVDESTRLDRLADLIGVSTAVVIVSVLFGTLWWLHAAVLRPLLTLSRAMDRFGEGDLEMRTREAGAAELRQMAARFNGMATALARQHEDRQTFLAAVAHDLRNPMAALQMSAEAIAADGSLGAGERLQRVSDVVQRQSRRVIGMLGDLLDNAQIEAGQLSLELDERDLRAVARDAVELQASTSKAHRVCLDLPPKPVIVRCDERRIEQALVNLLSNAIKYSPDGGRVVVSVRCEGGLAVLRVSDQGTGIRSDELESLWQPFRRQSSFERGVPGVGLGLSIVRRIARAHGGDVAVESQVGVGSTFRMMLPLLGVPPLGMSEASRDAGRTRLSRARSDVPTEHG